VSNKTENIASQTSTNTSADSDKGANKMPNATEGVIEQNGLGLYQSYSLMQPGNATKQNMAESSVDHQSGGHNESVITNSTANPQLDQGQNDSTNYL
jgi:hypothetical protein